MAGPRSALRAIVFAFLCGAVILLPVTASAGSVSAASAMEASDVLAAEGDEAADITAPDDGPGMGENEGNGVVEDGEGAAEAPPDAADPEGDPALDDADEDGAETPQDAEDAEAIEGDPALDVEEDADEAPDSKTTETKIAAKTKYLAASSGEVANPSIIMKTPAYAEQALVTNDAELRAAVADAEGDNYVIVLANDIKLFGPLEIPSNRSIVLTCGTDPDSGAPCRLIGASGKTTIEVGGTLILAGPIVTHEAGEPGRGVDVSANGDLTLESGGVSGNTIVGDSGGGIYMNGHSFKMTGGTISGNTAENGGGLYVSKTSINGNNFISISGSSVISGNAATGDGGGICIADHDAEANSSSLGRIIVSAGVVFSDNIAAVAYNRDNSDDATYKKSIGDGGEGVVWTKPFRQGYNNYDISYSGSSPTAIIRVVFNPGNGTLESAFEWRLVLSGESLSGDMPAPAPTRPGYTFNGWRTGADGAGEEFTADTIVSGQGDVIVYAQWKEIPTERPEKPEIIIPAAPDPPQPPQPPQPPDVQEEQRPVIVVQDAAPPAQKAVVENPPVKDIPPEAPPQAPKPPKAPVIEEAPPQPAPFNTEALLTYNQAPTPAQVLAALKEEGVPVLAMGGQEVPAFTVASLPVWAAANMMLAMAGLVMAISAIFRAAKARRKGGASTAGNRQALPVIVLAGAAGIILFLLTEDMRNLMVFFDKWTIVNALIFVTELMAIRSMQGIKKRAL